MKPDRFITHGFARSRYLHLLALVLTGQLFEDPSIDPWSGGKYNPIARVWGRDWPATALTMIGEKRLENLHLAVTTAIAEEVPGDLMETGVWRGGACIYIRAVLAQFGETDRRVWVADSFEGLPPPVVPGDAGDRHHTYPQLSVSLEEVRANFARFGLLDDRVVFLKGWFKDTLKTADTGPLAVLRLDGDMYESTMTALTELYPRVSPGGFVIVDDWFAVTACQRAVTDYWRTHGITVDLVNIDGMGAYWRVPL